MSDRTQAASRGYQHEMTIQAPRERVFAAVATVGGLRGWWTPIVAGPAGPGRRLAFGFEGRDEAIVVSIDAMSPPSSVRWTCLEHTAAPGWAGTTIAFELGNAGSEGCVLWFGHKGVPAEEVAAGWDRFLTSLTRLVETGEGVPYRAPGAAIDVARAYHAAWTGRNFAAARAYLAADLETDVPMNTYRGADDFVAAVARFGGLAERVELLAEFGSDGQALLLYDLHTETIGRFRVAEQFTVDDGLIRRIRHVHDTAVLRSAT